MFKDENEFGKTVDNLNIDTKGNPTHRQKLKQQMLSVFNETSQKTTGTSISDIWRIIMKSPITKFAAVITVVFFSLFIEISKQVFWAFFQSTMGVSSQKPSPDPISNTLGFLFIRFNPLWMSFVVYIFLNLNSSASVSWHGLFS